MDIIGRAERDHHFNEALHQMLPRESIEFIVCYAYCERDLFAYSSYCISISSIAAAVRYKTKSDSFYGVFLLLSLTDIVLLGEITECAELLYQKLKKFQHYQVDAREPSKIGDTKDS